MIFVLKSWTPTAAKADDLHNGRESGIRAQFALRDACDAVAKAGGSVVVAHGNHDPLLSAVPKYGYSRGFD